MSKHEGKTCSRHETNANKNMLKQCKHRQVCMQGLVVKEVVTGEHNSEKARHSSFAHVYMYVTHSWTHCLCDLLFQHLSICLHGYK